jgi:hypothetical protein
MVLIPRWGTEKIEYTSVFILYLNEKILWHSPFNNNGKEYPVLISTPCPHCYLVTIWMGSYRKHDTLMCSTRGFIYRDRGWGEGGSACPLEGFSFLCHHQWGRRLESWPNTAARLAGRRRVTQPGVILNVMDGPCRLPALTDHTTCPGSGADLVRNVHKTPSWAMSCKEGMACAFFLDSTIRLLLAGWEAF